MIELSHFRYLPCFIPLGMESGLITDSKIIYPVDPRSKSLIRPNTTEFTSTALINITDSLELIGIVLETPVFPIKVMIFLGLT